MHTRKVHSWRPLRLILEAFVGAKKAIVYLDCYLAFYHKLVKSRGKSNAIKILKDINSKFKFAAAGVKLEGNSFGGLWLKVDKRGLPKALRPLSRDLELHPNIVLLVVNYVYLLRDKPNYDISSIEDLPQNGLTQQHLDEFYNFAKRHLGKVRDIQETDKSCHMSVKAGPNGHAAIISSSIDTIALNMSPGSHWMLKRSCELTGRVKLWERFEKFTQSLLQVNLRNLKYPKQITTAKLSFLSDKAGKTRVVYILNWWVQEVLKPLHDELFEYLRHHPSDATFRQREVVDIIKSWTANGDAIYSFDLKSATDRWPWEHQLQAIKAFAGDNWAEVWEYGMKRFTPYSYPHKRWVFYNTGQPMGAYASWASLALTHHLTIHYCAWLVGEKPDYFVLGDDVVIKGHKVAKRYKEYLTFLGLTISEGKSITPDSLRPNRSSAEFAKHLLTDGKDYTPISPNLLKEIWEDHQWWKFPSLLMEIKEVMGRPVLYKSDSAFGMDPVVNLLYQTFTKKVQGRLAVILMTPDSIWSSLVNKEVSLDLTEGLTSYPNPWAKIPELSYLTVKASIIQDHLTAAYTKLDELRKACQSVGETSIRASGWLLELPLHPIYLVFDNLDQALMDVARTIDRGEIPTGVTQLLIDLDYLKEFLSNGKPYNEWRSAVDRRRLKDIFITEDIHRRLSDPNFAENFLEDLDWY